MEQLCLTISKEEYDQSLPTVPRPGHCYRDKRPKPVYSKDDEPNLNPQGYVLPRSAEGDSRTGSHSSSTTRHRGQGAHRRQRAGFPQICKEVGLPFEHVLTARRSRR